MGFLTLGAMACGALVFKFLNLYLNKPKAVSKDGSGMPPVHSNGRECFCFLEDTCCVLSTQFRPVFPVGS